MSEEKERIVEFIRAQIAAHEFGGAVVGISGGIDSAVVGTLLTEALGKHNVFGLLLPERDSSKTTVADSVMVCEFLGIHYSIRSITPLVRKLGVYRMKPPAFLFPRKIQEGYARAQWLNTANPYINDLKNSGGEANRKNLAYYRTKHRFRMIALYYEAEQRGYAVVGTTNKTEYLTGFYIKWGDDSSDIEPIMHVYKTQVFELAKELGIPKRIIEKKPSPDIAPGITDEFAMGIAYGDLDRILQKIELDQSLSDEKQDVVEKVREILSSAKYRNTRNINLLHGET
jgi:NAD+ synthase